VGRHFEGILGLEIPDCEQRVNMYMAVIRTFFDGFTEHALFSAGAGPNWFGIALATMAMAAMMRFHWNTPTIIGLANVAGFAAANALGRGPEVRWLRQGSMV